MQIRLSYSPSKVCLLLYQIMVCDGNTASSRMFSEIAWQYKDDFKVTLIDFLGHGKSDRLQKFPADLWFYEAQVQ